MYNLLFWVGVQCCLLHVLHRISSTYRDRRWFKLAFAPSLIVESAVRLAACCLSSKPVERVEFFADKKPFMDDRPSRIPYFGGAIFLLLWQGAIFYNFHGWAVDLEGVAAHCIGLPHVYAELIVEGTLHVDAGNYLEELGTLWNNLDWSSWKVWAFFYMTIGVFPYLSLNLHRLQQSAVVIAVLALVTAGIVYLGIRPAFLSRSWWLYGWILPDFFRVYSLFLTLLAATILLHVGIRLGWEVLCWQVREQEKRQKAGRKSPAKRRELEKVH